MDDAISTGAWLTSRATSRPTNCTTVRFASCPSSTTAPSSGSFTRCSITIPITQDITAFLHRFRMALRLRGLKLQGRHHRRLAPVS